MDVDRHYNHFLHHPPTTKLFKACISLLLSTLPVPYHSLISTPHFLNLPYPPTTNLPYPPFLIHPPRISCPCIFLVLSLSWSLSCIYLVPVLSFTCYPSPLKPGAQPWSLGSCFGPKSPGPSQHSYSKERTLTETIIKQATTTTKLR